MSMTSPASTGTKVSRKHQRITRTKPARRKKPEGKALSVNVKNKPVTGCIKNLSSNDILAGTYDSEGIETKTVRNKKTERKSLSVNEKYKPTIGRPIIRTNLIGEDIQKAQRAGIWDFAREVWGSDDSAREFLNRSHAMLEGRRPIEVALSSVEGAKRVNDILGSLQCGTAV